VKHVIIGAGAAGVSAAKVIRNLRSDDEIVIISSDEAVYSRCMLCKYISGKRSEAELSFVNEGFFEEQNIRRIPGTTVTGVDAKEKTVCFGGGSELYDKLLIATGAQNVIPPIGRLREAGNVYGLRDFADAKAIRERASQASDIVIIGASLTGLSAAYALLEMGRKPIIIESGKSILDNNLDACAAAVYREKFEEAGCGFRMGRKIKKTICDGFGMVRTIVLDSGEKLPCDYVVSTVGVQPELGYLEGSSIIFLKHVRVSKHLAARVARAYASADVYAAGDAAGLSGTWANAARQGEVAAMNMCGVPTVYDNSFALKNTINFFGITTLSIGQIKPTAGTEVQSREDRSRYETVLLQRGVPVGVILQGNISHSGFWQHLIKNKINVTATGKPIWKLSFADFYDVGTNGEYKWPVTRLCHKTKPCGRHRYGSECGTRYADCLV